MLKSYLLPFIVFFLLLQTGWVQAIEIRLSPPHRIYTVNKQLRVDLRTRSEMLDEELTKYLNYGIVLTFTYFINLYKDKFLQDEPVKKLVITKKVNYDIWSERFYLETNYPQKTRRTYMRISEFRKELHLLTGVLICPVAKIDKEGKYYFQTRNTLKITQLYSLFHIVFNFLSIFKYKTTYFESQQYTGDQLLSGADVKK